MSALNSPLKKSVSFILRVTGCSAPSPFSAVDGLSASLPSAEFWWGLWIGSNPFLLPVWGTGLRLIKLYREFPECFLGTWLLDL